VRQWGKKFGKAFSDRIRWRAPARGDKWHMDEVVVSISGEKHWLWRAVDQNGFVLDVLIQRHRITRAAQRLMARLLKSAIKPPRVMITDKLRSYGAARAKMGLRVEHRQHKGLNNRAEKSHQPRRRRERIMKQFKSSRQVQRFLSVHDQIANLFHIPYPKSVTANFRRASRKRAFAIWREISAIGAAASSHLPNKSPIFRSVLTKVDDAPWTHMPWGQRVGELDCGEAAGAGADAAILAFFESTLKGRPPANPPVALFDLGRRSYSDFPALPATREWVLHLTSTGRAAPTVTDGALIPEPGPATVDRLVHDPWRQPPPRVANWARSAAICREKASMVGATSPSTPRLRWSRN